MSGPVAELTPQFGFNLVNFDWVTWHDYEWANWVQADALLGTAVGFMRIRGIWRPSTDYAAGDHVYDPADTSRLLKALYTHTSSTSFAIDEPLYWLLVPVASTAVASVVVGATPPVAPLQGDLWYSTVDPIGLFMWFIDVNSSQWVQTQGGVSTSYNAFQGTLQVQGAPPYLQMYNTAPGLPDGLFRFTVVGDRWRAESNTAVIGDFSTVQALLDFQADDGKTRVLNPAGLEVAGPATFVAPVTFTAPIKPATVETRLRIEGIAPGPASLAFNTLGEPLDRALVQWDEVSDELFIANVHDGVNRSRVRFRLNGDIHADVGRFVGELHASSGAALQLKSGFSTGLCVVIRNSADVTLASFPPRGDLTAIDESVVMTRERADARYVNETAFAALAARVTALES